MDSGLDERQRLARRREEMEAISRKDMTRKAIGMAWPAIVEAVLQSTIRMVTSGLLGHIPVYSTLAVSASGLSERVTRLAWCIFSALGTGATVMIARGFGADDRDRANLYTEQAISVAVILIAVITAALLIFPEWLINALYNRGNQLNADLVTMAVDYLRLTAWGVPMMSINQIIGAITRGAGNTKVSLISNTSTNIANAILGYILIYGKYGAPALGIVGAGIASVISQGIGALIALVIFFRFQDDLRVHLGRVRLRWERIKEIFSIGVPHASEQLLTQFGQIALIGVIGAMGVVELAAHNQGINAESLSYMPGMGFSIATTTLVSMSVGVGSVSLAERYIKVLMKWTLALTAVTASCLILIPRQVFSLLSNEQAVINLGAIYLIIMGFCQFPQQMTWVYAGALRSGGDAKATMLFNIIGLWCVRLPLSILFASEAFGWGIIGVWIAMAIDIVTRFTLMYTRFRQGKWKREAYRIAGEASGGA